MSMQAPEIVHLITETIPDAVVEVEDLRGNGEHFAAYVESGLFSGKSRLEQHRMVFKALKGYMGDALHTLTLKTALPVG